jgi:hypothetical protein
MPCNYCLSEPVRFTKDNPIYKLSVHVRDGYDFDYGSEGDDEGSIQVVCSATKDMLLKADVILTGKNRTRHETNDLMRIYHKRRGPHDAPHMPVKDDVLVCLQNSEGWTPEGITSAVPSTVHGGL